MQKKICFTYYILYAQLLKSILGKKIDPLALFPGNLRLWESKSSYS